MRLSRTLVQAQDAADDMPIGIEELAKMRRKHIEDEFALRKRNWEREVKALNHLWRKSRVVRTGFPGAA